MGTIDTIRFRSFTVGGVTYRSIDAVPFRIWGTVLMAMIMAKCEKRRTRIHLSQLTEDELKDVGLTVDQADREIRKSLPFFERPHL